MICLALLCLLLAACASAEAADWVRAGINAQRPVWGIPGGIHVAIWPASVGEDGGSGGPRGLLRIGYPVSEDGKETGLVNFIAIEPITEDGVKCYSELEPSELDGVPGKRLWPARRPGAPKDPAKDLDPGVISRPLVSHPEIEQLTITLRMERFVNGAHPWLKVILRSDRPNEVELRAYAEADSKPMRSCILTATMGNYERLRLLHLKDGVVDSRTLFAGHTGSGFTRDEIFPLERLGRDAGGDVVVPLETDEADPAGPEPFPGSMAWRWRGPKLTQYWRKPRREVDKSLTFRVNARRTYWMSEQPIPGGVAYENAEFQERFRPGSPSIFGLTRRSATDLLKRSTKR